MSTVLNDIANKAKLFIQQGSELSLVFDLSNFTASIVGSSGTGQIRSTVDSAVVQATFDCVVDEGGMTMTATLTAAASAAITLDASTAAKRTTTTMAYDIEFSYSDGTTVRLLWGECEIIPEVTRA